MTKYYEMIGIEETPTKGKFFVEFYEPGKEENIPRIVYDTWVKVARGHRPDCETLQEFLNFHNLCSLTDTEALMVKHMKRYYRGRRCTSSLTLVEETEEGYSFEEYPDTLFKKCEESNG